MYLSLFWLVWKSCGICSLPPAANTSWEAGGNPGVPYLLLAVCDVGEEVSLRSDSSHRAECRQGGTGSFQDSYNSMCLVSSPKTDSVAICQCAMMR